jgi:hypothetical protein
MRADYHIELGKAGAIKGTNTFLCLKEMFYYFMVWVIFRLT